MAKQRAAKAQGQALSKNGYGQYLLKLAGGNIMSGLVKLIDLLSLGDDRGSLVALEANKTVPFDIKRVYYIFGTKAEVARGFHAHKALKQVAVCVTGSCRMVLDNGKHKETVWLDSPTKGLVIEDLVWREMHDFSPTACY
ncbi:hypothetical protein HSBAA_19180 [Vreelandella sulfidaeris]|uniref:Sugar 3,4-ketoisomerase QdtA cupin domain-containing protein n=1 Tax=Vreelandella sulfidaeris TaxID=115553 RepID=A0A455U3I2_9GAMM|nr:hypothetical protein HSBAA_19180 [Halomonas sulfidaeris]